MPSLSSHRLIAGLCVLLSLTACGGAPEVAADPAIEAEFAERRRAIDDEKAKQTYQGDLIQLDLAIDKYASAWLTSELQIAEKLRDKLETYLRSTVEKHFHRLLTTAEARDAPGNRAIALAALGFSGRPEAMDPMLNGARDDNSEVAIAALFGLAVAEEPGTPPGVLGEIMNDAKKTAEVRRNASLALMKLQEKSYAPNEIMPLWEAVLEKPLDGEDSGIQVHALRGIGLNRNTTHARLAEKFASHPHPKLRVAAAIAMGRLNNQSSVPTLLTMLGPGETNDNARLAARKALQALAGGIDRQYDVAAWRKAFDRSVK